MNYNYYYISADKTCVLSPETQKKTRSEDYINDSKCLIIRIEKKSVEHLSQFFKNAVMQAIISGDYELRIDSTDIEEFSFFSDTAFTELFNLIDGSLKACNATLLKIKSSLKSV